MNRILRSEYMPEWLPYFSRAFETLRPCGRGSYVWLGKVESSDILVVIAISSSTLRFTVCAGWQCAA